MIAFILSALIASAPGPDGGTHDAGQRPVDDGESNQASYDPPKTYRSPEGFQAAHWGMTRAEVKKAFPRGRTSKNEVVARISVAGIDTVAAFGFADNRLAYVRLDLVPKGEAADFHAAFAKIARGLNEKYGQPTYEHDEWKNRLFEDDYDSALALGHVVPTMSWQTDETEIDLSTNIGEVHRTIALTYKSRRLEDPSTGEMDRSEAKERATDADGL